MAPANDATLAQLRKRAQEPREPLPPVAEQRVHETPSCCQAAELMAMASIPEEVLTAIRMGRMTALPKPTGGVRGIVAGDIIRRLVSRTIVQQIRTKVEKATTPFQYALSTRNTEWVGAAHGRWRQCVAVHVAVLWIPVFLFEDSEGVVHEVLQGDGGEQGDALMTALFTLGEHCGRRPGTQRRGQPHSRIVGFKFFRFQVSGFRVVHCIDEGVAMHGRYSDFSDAGVLACFFAPALGGFGLRSAVRSRQSAFWASWLVRMRHPAMQRFSWRLRSQVWDQFPWWKQRIAVGI